MFTKNSIFKEINDLPTDKLEEVYEFVHSLGTKKKHKKKLSEKILSFAGSFGDMTKKEYADLKKNTKQTRANLFDRNSSL